ncbi:3-deoxy-7-phosphoheptulonate synthase [bacterium 210820-DFI.6.37]|nr:3-deoxy-7-phosphoheptulonate synthase [bacterium 210820-DFI.6.37]
MSVHFKRKLPIPKAIKEQYPMKEACVKAKAEREKQIKAILSGNDDRILMIIGPCSADREDAVLDYVSRLAKVQEKIKDKILIIPRVYTNKPRTVGTGYKGMLHRPNLLGDDDLLEGIIRVRQMHLRVIEETGLTAADEILYPDYYRYFSDLLSYAAVGARSTENQQHRFVASGLDIPVGMKNPTGGSFDVMLNSIAAAQHGYLFMYRGYEVESDGNPYAHGILRGAVRDSGSVAPNYHYEDLLLLYAMYSERDLLENKAVIIDTNHSNSGKKWYEQKRICKDVLTSCKYSKDIKKLVKGFMVESYLEDGNQPIDGGVYGKSVTDPCMGWDYTENFLYELADLL